jgi:hypothetical protein
LTTIQQEIAAVPKKKLRNDGPVQVPLSRDLFDRLDGFARSRGTDVETLVRVATATLLRAGRYYALDTPLAFGKYIGESMETVIRLDPGYVRWVAEKIEGLCLAEEASVLLERMLAETTVPRKEMP